MTCEELKELLATGGENLFARARAIKSQVFGDEIFFRGLIQFSNHCKQNCLYCGLRSGNKKLQRYRLSKEEILSCCEEGGKRNFKTFVLQSGEDDYYTTEKMTDIIQAIHRQFPNCVITLSIGEKDAKAYQAYYDAGARRFLLRHETINPGHYSKLHSGKRKIETRTECLKQLRKIGFQIGSGIMVGSPYQTMDNIIEDIYFIEKLKPEMIAVGPYLTCKDTPFKNRKNGDLKLTLRLLAIFRLMHPNAFIPATTALAALDPGGREKGALAGTNVIMLNLTPQELCKNYRIYDNMEG
ncbi:MAG: [FeFe] hydrogenase H-cluster radical SAM maturase HydE [Fibromonadales bacterium]|nr:[FeFe] hydrogenase H-cluster radical SAM maturase HydE [Fibromonadales bacterium]